MPSTAVMEGLWQEVNGLEIQARGYGLHVTRPDGVLTPSSLKTYVNSLRSVVEPEYQIRHEQATENVEKLRDLTETNQTTRMRLADDESVTYEQAAKELFPQYNGIRSWLRRIVITPKTVADHNERAVDVIDALNFIQSVRREDENVFKPRDYTTLEATHDEPGNVFEHEKNRKGRYKWKSYLTTGLTAAGLGFIGLALSHVMGPDYSLLGMPVTMVTLFVGVPRIAFLNEVPEAYRTLLERARRADEFVDDTLLMTSE